ncbi:MAG: formate dehydrogenase subunit delta [Hyphomonas sp.]
MKALDKYIRMANQIAANLTAQAPDNAHLATAAHIEKFWDPRMRATLDEHVAAGGEGLSSIALKALQTLALADDTP